MKSPGERLLEMCRQKNVPAALALVEEGVDLNYKDKEEITPLWVASQMGLTEVVVALLATKKVDVNAADSVLGMTPLIQACWKSHEAIALALLQEPSIRMDAKSNFGTTAFNYIQPTMPAVRKIFLDKLLEGEPPVYVYSGHGGDTVGTLKDVPKGSKYINMGTCGLLSRPNIVTALHYLNSPEDKRFVETNVPQIEELLDELSIRIFMPNPQSDKDRYVNNTFHPIGVYPNEDGTFDLRQSGLIERKKSVSLASIERHSNLKTVTLDVLKSLFSTSVYPTVAEVDTYFREKCGDRLEALTYADLRRANFSLSITVETLMTRFPGIHYNFLCRSVMGNSNIPAPATILRRALSVEGGRRPENAIRQSYQEKYNLLNLLETALLFEERHIPLHAERLARISKSPIHKIVPGDDSALKTSLVTHLAAGPASSWNPPELTQPVKDTLLFSAVEKGYERSIQFLLSLGASVNTLTPPGDREGVTPLMWACKESREEIAQLLLKAPGLDVNLRNPSGKSALSYCGDKMPAVRARLLALGATETVAERAASEQAAAKRNFAERAAKQAAERAAAEKARVAAHWAEVIRAAAERDAILQAAAAAKQYSTTPAVPVELLAPGTVTELNICNRTNGKQVNEIKKNIAGKTGSMYIFGTYTDTTSFVASHTEFVQCAPREEVYAMHSANGGAGAHIRRSRRSRHSRRSRRNRRNRRSRRRSSI
jgi:ankyrin repeat protein